MPVSGGGPKRRPPHPAQSVASLQSHSPPEASAATVGRRGVGEGQVRALAEGWWLAEGWCLVEGWGLAEAAARRSRDACTHRHRHTQTHIRTDGHTHAHMHTHTHTHTHGRTGTGTRTRVCLNRSRADEGRGSAVAYEALC